MSHSEVENQGTGLEDVFSILVKAPYERLISLTFQLGDSPEDSIVLALTLLILRREEQALEKLQMMRDNPLASHLSDKWHASGGKLDNFSAHCGQFQAQTGESLSLLARVFKVLSEQRLCEPLLRSLAYKRALSSDYSKTNNSSNFEYHHLIEEAKVVCGPQFVEWMGSSSELKSEFSLDPNQAPDGENSTLKASASQDESSSVPRLPSPLQESPSEMSYPTHLEISIPPTISFQGDKKASETSENSKPNLSMQLVNESEAKIVPGQCQSPEPKTTSTESSLLGAEKGSMADEMSESMSSSLQSNNMLNKPSTETNIAPPTAKHIFLPKIPVPKSFHDTEEEEEEETFYAFVILHTPEDADQAERIKEKMEKVIGSKGATFSEDFAIPGKSTLTCVEDAINNSAFTFLLLTRNFNSKMVETKMNIALFNSINHRHKYNTVIPLLPADNCMPKSKIPIVLQTLVVLDEKKSFDRKLQKSFSATKIEKQRRIWTEEQKVKRRNRLSSQEADRLNLYMEQNLLLSSSGSHEGGDGRALWPPQPNIHIENANYIMIGNDSTMTVDLGGSSNNDGSV